MADNGERYNNKNEIIENCSKNEQALNHDSSNNILINFHPF